MVLSSFASPEILHGICRRQKQGQSAGLYAVCSSNRQVLEAALQFARQQENLLLVETTCNQVNQYGGYTGLTPQAFTEYIILLAKNTQFPNDRLLLGGDHLGPYPWRNQESSAALAESATLIQAYVAHGYRKIHIDTSISCADDPVPLDKITAARRAAQLCRVAENEAGRYPESPPPVYVVGTEVPAPGGSTSRDGTHHVTIPGDAMETLQILEREFRSADLDEAWDRVVALVVQPGVEFDDERIYGYDRSRTVKLVEWIRGVSDIIFEAHSTDYQTLSALTHMVADQFAILKVGPALTFAFREAVMALAFLEMEWLPRFSGRKLSGIKSTLIEAMAENPEHWRDHYQGSVAEIRCKQIYSYSDRIRYYWDRPDVRAALNILVENLRQFPPPFSLISQALPKQYERIMDGLIGLDPLEWIKDKIQEVLKKYDTACRFQENIISGNNNSKEN